MIASAPRSRACCSISMNRQSSVISRQSSVVSHQSSVVSRQSSVISHQSSESFTFEIPLPDKGVRSPLFHNRTSLGVLSVIQKEWRDEDADLPFTDRKSVV